MDIGAELLISGDYNPVEAKGREPASGVAYHFPDTTNSADEPATPSYEISLRPPIPAKVFYEEQVAIRSHDGVNTVLGWMTPEQWEQGNPLPYCEEIDSFIDSQRSDPVFSYNLALSIGHVMLCREAIDAVVNALKDHNIGDLIEINASHNNGYLSKIFQLAGIHVTATDPRPEYYHTRHYPIEKRDAKSAMEFCMGRAVLLSYSEPRLDIIDKEGKIVANGSVSNERKITQNKIPLEDARVVHSPTPDGISILKNLPEGGIFIHIDFDNDIAFQHAINSCCTPIGYEIPLPKTTLGEKVTMRIYKRNKGIPSPQSKRPGFLLRTPEQMQKLTEESLALN